MAQVIYSLCALTAFAVSWLLFRSYFRTRARLLFWSGLCFAGMFINNMVLVLDHVILPMVDFTPWHVTTWRLATALIALLPLLYGLIWDEE